MKRHLLPALLLAACVGGAVGAAAQAPSAAEIASQVQQKYDSVRDFSADFTHEAESGVLRKKLVEHGIEESRVKTSGFGPDKPIDPAKTSKARAKNRRIEFRVLIDRPEGASSSDDGDAPSAAPATGK